MKGLNVKNMMKMVNVENATIVVLLVILLILVVRYVKKNNENFDSKNVKLYFFYVDWCPHCRNAKPVIDKLNLPNTEIIKVDCEDESNNSLAKDFGVKAYPTIVFDVDGERHDYNKPVSDQGFVDFLKDLLN